MTLYYGGEVFLLPPHGNMGILTTFGGNPDTGGDYHGPMVVIAVAVDNPNRLLVPTTVGVIMKAQNDEFTTNAVYSFGIQNESEDSVSFKIHYFTDY